MVVVALDGDDNGGGGLITTFSVLLFFLPFDNDIRVLIKQIFLLYFYVFLNDFLIILLSNLFVASILVNGVNFFMFVKIVKLSYVDQLNINDTLKERKIGKWSKFFQKKMNNPHFSVCYFSVFIHSRHMASGLFQPLSLSISLRHKHTLLTCIFPIFV